jgi:polysaccharide deacetylase 2 family uncharacterized protein YibQ
VLDSAPDSWGQTLATDDLDAPLGISPPSKKPLVPPIAVPHAIAGALGLFVLVFAVWAAVVNDPLGGEPVAVVAAAPQPAKPAEAPAVQASAKAAVGPGRYDGPAPGAAAPKEPPAPRTVTIIDGTSGKKQEVVISGAPGTKDSIDAPAGDPRLLENSRHGAIPKIGADGARPADVYARAVSATPGNPDGPRIALIVGGLGVGAKTTAEALAKLPGAVTLAFAPYGSDLETLVGRARAKGHELLLQVPMEPFDYPDNDPGPQTLLTSLSADQNVDRLHWLLSRFQGYVGITNYMGARFTAADSAIGPVLRETTKRGLIYVDDGSSARSAAGQIAGANKVPFVKADLMIDTVPTGAEIDKALARLEAIARERGSAVGVGQALPVTIERMAKWAKSATGRGVMLVPITALTVKAKSS